MTGSGDRYVTFRDLEKQDGDDSSLRELLDQTSDITTSLKMIVTQHIPDLTLKHDALVHQSAEAILTAQRLEMDAATLFRHADEIATPLKRYDAVDTWSNVLGLVFHPWIQGNHSSGATAPGGGGGTKRGEYCHRNNTKVIGYYTKTNHL